VLRKLVVPELLMLSNGLPPPLPTLPERWDWASAGDMLVLLVVPATLFDEVSTIIAADVDDFGVVAGGGAALVFIDVRTVELGVMGTLESVSIPVVAVGNEESIIVLFPMEAVLLMDIVIGTPGVSPVVVVTTATLQSS
jgi:hypothetical protein